MTRLALNHSRDENGVLLSLQDVEHNRRLHPLMVISSQVGVIRVNDLHMMFGRMCDFLPHLVVNVKTPLSQIICKSRMNNYNYFKIQ